ncbi:MAG: Crp/Fnr family transcriptional regulator [Pirellulales bacterium]|nr:Crp/Fnr family transcriptional regulator [Pirellulales bacterium]
MPQNIIDILHECKLFSHVPHEGFRRLATMAKLCVFRKGQLIFRENDDCPGVYMVGSGQIRVFKTGSGGKEHVLHIVGPGGTFAEVAAIGGFPLPASAQSLVKSTCVLLPSGPFRKLLDDDPATTKAMLLGLTHWVRHLVSLMEDLVLRDAAGRIARLLLDAKPVAEGPVGGGIVKLPGLKRHLASHLNLTSETFSRTFRRLIDAGLIAEAKNNRVELIDPKALRRVAEGMYPTI